MLAVVVAAPNDTFPNDIDHTAATDAVIAGADAALSALGAVTVRAFGWGWAQVAALPWERVPRAVAQVTRDLTGRISTAAGALTRTDSGEPLGAGRVTAYATG